MAREKSTVTRKSYGFRIDIELAKKLKILAAKRAQAVNVILEEAIQDLLKKHTGKR